MKNRPIIRLVLGLCLFASGVTGLIYLFAFAEQVPQELFIPAGLATLIGIAVVLSDPPPKVQKKKRESDWKDTGGKVVRALGWLWLVAVNIFYVLVVLYVFARLTGRTEHILVSILGLIYVAIRGQSLGLAMTLPSTFLAIHREFARIRALLREKSVPTPTRELDDDEFLEDIIRDTSDKELADTERKIERQYWKLAVDGLFLSVVGLICIFQLFTALSG